MAAGFSESVLIKGAGVAHFLSNAQLPEGWEVDDLKTWDDPRDRGAIRLGIRLYRIRPGWVWTEDLVGQVRLSPLSLRARPYRP